MTDAAIAQSGADRQAFWAIRNDIPALARSMFPRLAYDVSVPISGMAAYVTELRELLSKTWPSARALAFGHVADNNLHVVVTLGPDTLTHSAAVSEIVYRGVVSRNGSISAEHGIGLEKRSALAAHVSAPAMSLMRQLKQLLDPGAVLNPGKVL